MSGTLSVSFWWAFLAFLNVLTRFGPLPLTRPAAGVRTVMYTRPPTVLRPIIWIGQPPTLMIVFCLNDLPF